MNLMYRIMERKISKQVIESLGSTENMSSVNEKTPEQNATGGAAASSTDGRDSKWHGWQRIAELYETPRNSKITDRDGKGRWRRALFPNSTK